MHCSCLKLSILTGIYVSIYFDQCVVCYCCMCTCTNALNNTCLLSLLCVSAADDHVYLENEDDRREYVLNGSGRIWSGTSRSPFARKWEFEQVCLQLPRLAHKRITVPVTSAH